MIFYRLGRNTGPPCRAFEPRLVVWSLSRSVFSLFGRRLDMLGRRLVQVIILLGGSLVH